MSPCPFYPQADVEGLRSQGIHVIVAGPRDDNPADWQGLVLGNLDLIVGTASVSDMLNFRPFQYNVHDVLSNISGNCQFILAWEFQMIICKNLRMWYQRTDLLTRIK